MKVSGICPPFTLVKETNKISMNTIPEAPSRPVLKKVILSMPVIKAVNTMIAKVNLEPYFSSTIGPNRRMKVILPNKCSILPWPKTCENKLNIDTGSEKLTLVPTAK